MARQRRSAPARSGPSRPTAAPARPSPQNRGMSTTAYPPSAPAKQGAMTSAPSAPQQQGSGLFGQMASTAAGVAVGSSIGHAIGGFFGGGSGAAAPAEPVQSAAANTYGDGGAAEGNDWGVRNCEADAREFTKCLGDNQGNMQICSWYLEQLKSCQAAAAPY
ncbi:MAG: hypothetical protein M1829_003880 [Trizodia sp. TS-e1964]|nr:MAG: hypothetical protein M1829_003880 [Trizodia sp. TS-e1964]